MELIPNIKITNNEGLTIGQSNNSTTFVNTATGRKKIFFPNATDQLVGQNTSDTFKNKTGTDLSNNFSAKSIICGGTSISFSPVPLPKINQVPHIISVDPYNIGWTDLPASIPGQTICSNTITTTNDNPTTIQKIEVKKNGTYYVKSTIVAYSDIDGASYNLRRSFIKRKDKLEAIGSDDRLSIFSSSETREDASDANDDNGDENLSNTEDSKEDTWIVQTKIEDVNHILVQVQGNKEEKVDWRAITVVISTLRSD